jgi:long-chain fatty acid transport protein
MKKKLFFFVLLTLTVLSVRAGGIMTNTNYHIAFDRMFARGATFDIDAVFSNPAGLVWGYEGWQMSLNFQKPWQNRDIESTFPLLQPMYGSQTYKFEGKASAPIVPAIFASYKKDRWAVSTMIGIVGSGGFVKYDEGVPMFNVMVGSMLSSMGVTADQYKLSSQMKGKQYIYGGQVNFTYRLLDCLSAAVGVRANYYDGYYRGHVVANEHPLLGDLVGLQLDVDQRAWGFTPLVSIDYHQGPLTVAARYEWRTKINTTNTTNMLEADLGSNLKDYLAKNSPATLQAIAGALGSKITPYVDGAETRYDMPSLLTFAVGYEFTPRLRGALEYHFYDDKHAQMANNRQEQLEHGTHEFLAGMEYDINDKFTISCGGQRTDYGLADDFQTNTSFACDSYSVGLGGAVNLTDKLRLNVSYFCTLYSDYTVESSNYLGTGVAGKDVYSRTNHVIGVGLDFKF